LDRACITSFRGFLTAVNLKEPHFASV